MKPQLMASAGLLALALAAPAKGLTITNYPQPLHYVIPRNCCPSRYAAISAWHQHRRCGARERRVGGGMSGGGGGGGGVGFQVTGVPVEGPPFSVVGPPGGGGGPPPTVAGPPTVETPPPVPIPGPTMGEGVGGLISIMALAAAAVALGRRRKKMGGG